MTLGPADAATIRAADGGEVAEVAASKAFATGRASAAFNREYLVRALGMGPTTVELSGPDKPVVARDAARTYLWAALAPDAVVPPPGAAPVESDPEENTMPSTTPNGHPPPKPPDGSQPDLPAEAEAIRDLLHDAAGRLGRLVAALRRRRRQTRAIRQAVESLRGPPPFDT